jgi:hypothetical protein
MDIQTINNLISFVACAIAEGDKETAIFAAKGLDLPKEVKDHIINIFCTLPDNVWDKC